MLFSIHSDEWKSFQSQHQIALRIRRWRYNLIPVESKFKNPMLDHQDKFMMKAQYKLRGRLLASFQDLEHEGGDTRSQGGIKENDIEIKIQDVRCASNESKEFPRTRLKVSRKDEKVIGLGYTPMFLTYSDEALEIKKFKRSRENKIEFAYDYGNLNASYVDEKINLEDDYFQEIINLDFEKFDSPFQQTNLDTFSSVKRPKNSGVIWKKKGSSIASNVGLSVILPQQAKETKAKSSIKEPPELELKELPSHLKYAFLEETDKLPMIIAKDLKDDEKEALLKVLKSQKWAIAWKITVIKGIDPRFCTHKILMKEDYKPMVQSRRRVNPKIHEVIKKEVIKLLDAGMIYSISDSPWVSPVYCVPKKGGMTIVANENDELIPTRLVTDPQDQEKTAFTCRYGTFAYRRMPFGLCNAPGVRSFLGHAGFYRRFIQDFSKIARHMTHLLEKETPFVFIKNCIDAFETLKKKVTQALILVVPDWNLPFELMCEASDFAIGAVLGQ
nr:hypothetical protein [Tanacetum cinerariifolium]